MLLKKKTGTQLLQILNLHNYLGNAKILVFIHATNIHRVRLKIERKIWQKKWFGIYKTNLYRANEVFKAHPLNEGFDFFFGAFHNKFIIASSAVLKKWKNLADIFQLATKYTKAVFALQNKTFLTDTRFFTHNLKKKAQLVSPLMSQSNLLSVLKVRKFLTKVLVEQQSWSNKLL